LQRGLTELTVDGRKVEKAISLADDGKTHNVIASMRPSSVSSPPSSAPTQQEKARL
jgi:hypothetical protein